MAQEEEAAVPQAAEVVLPEPIWEHMPDIIKEKILGAASPIFRGNLRLVSHEFKRIVDAAKTVYDSFRVTLEQERITLIFSYPGFGWTEIRISQKRGEYLFTNERTYASKSVKGQTHWQGAAEYVVQLLGNPKRSCKHFFISLPRENNDDEKETRRSFLAVMSQGFSQLSHKISVKKFTFINYGLEQEPLEMLRNFKPGTLQSIQLHGQFERVSGQTTALALLPQWEEALDLDTTDFDMTGAYRNFCHFRKSTIMVDCMNLKVFKAFLEMFHQHPNIKYNCITSVRPRTEAEVNYFNDYMANYPLHDGKRHIVLPDTDGYLEVSETGLQMKIRRVCEDA